MSHLENDYFFGTHLKYLSYLVPTKLVKYYVIRFVIYSHKTIVGDNCDGFDRELDP